MPSTSPERQRTLRLQQRVFEFAAAILAKCPSADSYPASRETWRNLVRSAPSASYNLEEADEASSDADFIAKLKIALREARESRQALRFITRCRLANYEQLEGLEDEARQISSILAAIIINKRKSMAAKTAQRSRPAADR